MNLYDFEKIVLTKEEEKLFEKFEDGKSVKLEKSEARKLTHHGLIEQDVLSTDENGYRKYADTYSLSDKGNRFMVYRNNIQKDQNRGFFRDVLMLIIGAFVALIFENYREIFAMVKSIIQRFF